MSLLDLASLVLSPTATKEGKVYSAIPDTGEGDMTFTRGSAATRVNSEGLIEKERGNLLLQSNTFDTTWLLSGVTRTSGQSGYDGSNNAWKIDKTTSYGYIYQNISTSGVLTFSIYAKAGTVDWVLLHITASSTYYQYIDLTNGNIGAGTNISSKTTSVGNGWYKCEIAFNDSSVSRVRVYPAIDDGDVSGTSGNIYIQDAMLNQGLVATDYIETTTSAVYEGITDDVPRVDYSGGGCPSLLLESQRSNLLPQSEYFGASDWLKTGLTIASNEVASPDGNLNATEVTITNGAHFLFDIISVSASTTYTFSWYAKRGTATNVSYSIYDNTNSVDIISSTSYYSQLSDTEWKRISVQFTTSATTTSVRPYVLRDGGQTGTISIYGAMVEAGSYSTSYIPTYGVSSTRVADFAIKSNASNLIGQTEGTIFIEFTRENNSVGTFSISANNVGTRIYIGTNASGLICQVRNGYAQQAYFSTAQTEGTKYKCAIAYATNDFVLYMNGTQIGTDTSGTVPECNTIRTDDAGGANLNQPLNQAILFPTRLTNDQLEELTK